MTFERNVFPAGERSWWLDSGRFRIFFSFGKPGSDCWRCSPDACSQVAVESRRPGGKRRSVLRATHRRGKPIKVIEKCDQSITGGGGREEREDKAWEISDTPHLSTRGEKAAASQAGQHSLCSGMNKALHTWNFLGHRATPHYHANTQGSVPIILFPSVRHI